MSRPRQSYRYSLLLHLCFTRLQVELLLGENGLLANDTRTASGILTLESFENAIATIYALGGSTNAVIHLLAIGE